MDTSSGIQILLQIFSSAAIRESRGKDVIREVLGSDWKGTIVCDGTLSVMAGLRTRVTIFRGAGPIYCARSEISCARTLTVRRQNRCCALSQMRTDAERMPKKYPNPKQKTWKHLSLGASCTNICAGAYAESSKSGPIARICKSFASSLATRTRICSDSSWIRRFPQPTTPQNAGYARSSYTVKSVAPSDQRTPWNGWDTSSHVSQHGRCAV